jgi:hypothetical protein
MRLVRMLLILVVTLPLWSCGSGPNEPQPPEGGVFRFSLWPGTWDPYHPAVLVIHSVRIFDEPTRIVASSHRTDRTMHIEIRGVETAMDGQAPGNSTLIGFGMWPGDFNDGEYTLVFDYEGESLEYQLEIDYPTVRILGDTHEGRFIQPAALEFDVTPPIFDFAANNNDDPLIQFEPVTP